MYADIIYETSPVLNGNKHVASSKVFWVSEDRKRSYTC